MHNDAYLTLLRTDVKHYFVHCTILPFRTAYADSPVGGQESRAAARTAPLQDWISRKPRSVRTLPPERMFCAARSAAESGRENR